MNVLYSDTTDKSDSCTSLCGNSTLTSVRMSSLINGQERGLVVLRRGSRGMSKKLHASTWDTIVSEGVPMSLRELVNIVADNLGLEVNYHNSNKLLKCSWNLGWHVSCTTCCGMTRNFRGGGETRGITSAYLRGDWVETSITDEVDHVRTSRLCRIICAVKIKNLKKITGLDFSITSDDAQEVTWQTEKNKADDKMIFLLVRYAKPHPHARERGPQHRPLCPGILKDTHCLWTWAKRDRTFRRGCFVGRAWERNKHFFGDSLESQNSRRELERYAWYDLIQVSDIVAHANVQIDPDRDQAFLQSVMWW